MLRIQPPEDDYGQPDPVYLYERRGDRIIVPKGFYPTLREKGGEFGDEFDPNDRIDFPKRSFLFKGSLFATEKRDQKKVAASAIRSLQKYRCVLLSLYCGFGKTISAIYLACRIQLKTCVIMHQSVLKNQWIESIREFSDAKVQLIEGKKDVDPDADICLITPLVAGKKDPSFFKDFGTLICDEVHVMCAHKFSRALLRIHPKYFIGLSATPHRKDGLDKVLEICFPKEARIKRVMNCTFDVYDFRTRFVPSFEYNVQGRVNWNSLLASIIDCEERNDVIARLTSYFPDRTILILTKRVDHCKDLHQRIANLGESVTMMTGSQMNYDKKARILISTFSKLGVGFDDKRLDMLILACDIGEVEQYAGRVFRRHEEISPLIIDLVDEHGTLKRHWQTRRQWYLSRGAKIQPFVKAFPDFPGARGIL